MAQVLDKPQKVQSFLPNLKETPEERLQHLIAEHKGKLAASYEELLGSDGDDDETADDIIKAVREWRDFSVNRSVD
ncbi:MAG: hypothetical protein LH614_11570 [Pyrinomonadaceae bacterium]|nr:hypothetical protein [Pyrinomonadaceae bacterium]